MFFIANYLEFHLSSNSDNSANDVVIFYHNVEENQGSMLNVEKEGDVGAENEEEQPNVLAVANKETNDDGVAVTLDEEGDCVTTKLNEIFVKFLKNVRVHVMEDYCAATIPEKSTEKGSNDKSYFSTENKGDMVVPQALPHKMFVWNDHFEFAPVPKSVCSFEDQAVLLIQLQLNYILFNQERIKKAMIVWSKRDGVTQLTNNIIQSNINMYRHIKEKGFFVYENSHSEHLCSLFTTGITMTDKFTSPCPVAKGSDVFAAIDNDGAMQLHDQSAIMQHQIDEMAVNSENDMRVKNILQNMCTAILDPEESTQNSKPPAQKDTPGANEKKGNKRKFVGRQYTGHHNYCRY